MVSSSTTPDYWASIAVPCADTVQECSICLHTCYEADTVEPSASPSDTGLSPEAHTPLYSPNNNENNNDDSAGLSHTSNSLTDTDASALESVPTPTPTPTPVLQPHPNQGHLYQICQCAVLCHFLCFHRAYIQEHLAQSGSDLLCFHCRRPLTSEVVAALDTDNTVYTHYPRHLQCTSPFGFGYIDQRWSNRFRKLHPIVQFMPWCLFGHLQALPSIIGYSNPLGGMAISQIMWAGAPIIVYLFLNSQVSTTLTALSFLVGSETPPQLTNSNVMAEFLRHSLLMSGVYGMMWVGLGLLAVLLLLGGLLFFIFVTYLWVLGDTAAFSIRWSLRAYHLSGGRLPTLHTTLRPMDVVHGIARINPVSQRRTRTPRTILEGQLYRPDGVYRELEAVSQYETQWVFQADPAVLVQAEDFSYQHRSQNSR